jgi:hypothetical protein
VTDADPLVANTEIGEKDDRPRHLRTTEEASRLSDLDATSARFRKTPHALSASALVVRHRSRRVKIPSRDFAGYFWISRVTTWLIL